MLKTHINKIWIPCFSKDINRNLLIQNPKLQKRVGTATKKSWNDCVYTDVMEVNSILDKDSAPIIMGGKIENLKCLISNDTPKPTFWRAEPSFSIFKNLPKPGFKRIFKFWKIYCFWQFFFIFITFFIIKNLMSHSSGRKI